MKKGDLVRVRSSFGKDSGASTQAGELWIITANRHGSLVNARHLATGEELTWHSSWLEGAEYEEG